MSQHLFDERRTQHIGLVLELDDRPPGVEHHRNSKRKVGGYRAQFELSHGDAVQRESAGALAHAEAQSDKMVHAIVSHALRIYFAYHPIDADGLMREATKTCLAYRVDRGGKGVLRS